MDLHSFFYLIFLKLFHQHFLIPNLGNFFKYTFENLRMKRKLKCDFYLPKHNSIIEFNGSQHYIPVERFGGEEGLKRTQNSDELKRNFCIENQIKLLEIKYNEDVYDCLNFFLNL